MNYRKLNFKNLKSALLLTGFLLSINLNVTGQEFLSLKKIVNGPTPTPYQTLDQSPKPTFIEATSAGGKMEISVKFKNGNQFCTVQYRYEWQFSVPIDQLYKGKPVNIEYKVTRLSGSCPSAKGRISATPYMGRSEEFKQLGIRYGGGLDIKPIKWIEVGVSMSESNTCTLIALNATVQDAVFVINFDSQGYAGSEQLGYEVVYVYGHQTQVNCDPDMNCHNLYSVGVAIAFAEYGALTNAEPKNVADNVDIAIGHAKASKCVPTDKLISLRQKLNSASSSYPLYNEISTLRNDLAIYVEKNCNCCKN
jgi:hypothetical protein